LACFSFQITSLKAVITKESIPYIEESSKTFYKTPTDVFVKMARSTELINAVEKDKLNLVRRLIRRGTDVNCQDSTGWTALHHAALYGYTKMAANLVRLGANVNAIDIFGNTPLHSACSEGSSEIIIKKLNRDLRIMRTLISKTPAEMELSLRKMTEDLKIEMVDCLLKHGSNINATYRPYLTSLHRVVRHGNVCAVNVLAGLGVDVNGAMTTGRTALVLAINQAQVGLVEHLVKNGAEMNLSFATETAIHIAVKNKRRDLVDILVLHGADVNISRITHGTFFAALNMCTDHKKSRFIQNLNQVVLKKLAQLGVAVGAPQSSIPLILDTLEYQDADMMKHLVHHGADINAGIMYKPVLSDAITLGDCDIIDLLIECGVNVNATFVADVTSVHEAVRQKQTKAMKILAELGADLNQPKLTGFTAIMCALLSGNDAIVKHLASLGADINMKIRYETSLYYAVKNEQMKAVEALVENGADVNASTHTLPTWVQKLQQPSSNTDAPYDMTNSTFPEPVYLDQELENFAELGVDFNATQIKTPIIFEAAKCRESNILQYLVQHGADISRTCLSTSLTYLDYFMRNPIVPRSMSSRIKKADCSWKGHLHTIEKLVKCGANINTVGFTMTSLLVSTLKEGEIEMVKSLVKLGVPVTIDLHNPSIYEARGLLNQAIEAGDMDLVRGLLHLGADVNRRQDQYVSALHYAVARGNGRLLRALCCLKPNVNSFREEGVTPLHSAIRRKGTDLEMIKVLVEAGADLNAGYSEYITPLHDAAKLPNTEIVETLKEFGADMQCQKTEHIKPIHIATNMYREDVLEYFAEIGADMDVTYTDNVRPLNEAVRVGNTDMVRCLTRCGANVESRKKAGLTPLFAAIVSSHTELANRLIRLGADINAKISKQVSLLHDAVEYRDIEMLEALVQLGMEVRTERWEISLLGVCANSNYMEMAHCLLTNGVNRHGDQGAFITVLGDALLGDSLECVEKLASLINQSEAMFLEVNTNQILVPVHGTPAMTALDMACQYGLLDMARLLILNGCHSNEAALDKLPLAKSVKYSTIKETLTANRVRELIKMDTHYESVFHLPSISIEAIPHTVGVGDVKCIPSPKSTEVAAEVYDVFNMLVKNLEFFPGGKLHGIGSMGEGTKVLLPDEMDFLVLFELEKFEGTKVAGAGFGYAYCKNESIPMLKGGSMTFHIYFIKDMTNAMAYLNKTPECRVAILIDTIAILDDDNRKACSFLPVRWSDESSSILISVDIVPCLHINDWPKDGTQKTWLMDYATLKNRGYLIVPKPPHVKSALAKRCTEEDLEELWRISFSHLETEHMQRLEQRVKDVYITAKSLRSPEFCRILIKEEGSYDKPADKYVTSYMLKMMFLKNVENFLATELSLGAMVLKVYDDLVEALSKEFVPLFFMPTANALDGLKLDVKKCAKVARIMQKFVHKLYERDNQASTGGSQQAIENASRQRAVYLCFDISG
jgi:ankyrin repeat protein